MHEDNSCQPFDGLRHIAQAFLKLYEEHDIEDITIAQLVNESGYSRSSFYRRFHSVYDLRAYLYELYRPHDAARYVLEHAEDITPEIYIGKFMAYFAQNEYPLRVLLRRDDGTFGQLLYESVVPPYRTFLRSRNSCQEEDLDTIVDYMVRAKVNQLGSWAKNPNRSLVEEMMLPLKTTERSFWGI